MRTETITIYTYEELPTEKAKEKARDWYLEIGLDYTWYDAVYEDAKQIGLKINHFDIDHGTIGGKLTDTIDTIIKNIMENHGPQCETYRTAITWRDSDDAQEFRKALLEDYLVMLRNEYEYLTSDDCAIEAIIANEYEFTEDGERY